MKLDKVGPIILKNIRWDLTPEQVFASHEISSQEDWDFVIESAKQNTGYYFYIDVWDMNPKLMLMHSKKFAIEVVGIIEDVPRDMLENAIEEAGGAINISGHYSIDTELKAYLHGRIDMFLKEAE